MEGPNPFLESLPTQLRAWDASALRVYMECPRKYWYSMVEGWRGKNNVDLEFGGFYHASLDLYDKTLAKHGDKEEALDQALKFALEQTYSEEGGDPVYWGGKYATEWKCTGKVKTEKGWRKCPYSKFWHSNDPGQEACGTCGAPFISELHWLPYNKNKNRHTLISAIVNYHDWNNDAVKPYKFPDGKVASELSFRLELPFSSPDGPSRPYLLTGNMDGIVHFLDEYAPRERKTTKNNILDMNGYNNRSFFAKYEPDVQVDTYDLASNILYGDTLKPSGVLMEVLQVGVNFARHARELVTIPSERREEWFGELEYWIKSAENNAKSGFYPKNTASCSSNGGCPFRGICKLAPSARAIFLPEHFVKQYWNPLQER